MIRPWPRSSMERWTLVERERRVSFQRPYLFKTWRRVAQLLQHGPLDRRLADVPVVLPRTLGAAGSPAGALVPRLVEIRLSHQNEGLD